MMRILEDIVDDQVCCRVIAYELPEAAGRAEAIRYVESIRDRFKQGAEVLDAATNEAILKSKLKNGFLLYTTLGEKSASSEKSVGH